MDCRTQEEQLPLTNYLQYVINLHKPDACKRDCLLTINRDLSLICQEFKLAFCKTKYKNSSTKTNHIKLACTSFSIELAIKIHHSSRLQHYCNIFFVPYRSKKINTRSQVVYIISYSQKQLVVPLLHTKLSNFSKTY